MTDPAEFVELSDEERKLNLAEIGRGFTVRVKHLDEDGQAEVKATQADLADLIRRKARGEDVSQPLREADATMRSWTYVGNQAARNALLESAAHAANVLAQALGQAAGTAAGAALNGLAGDMLRSRAE